MAIEQYIRGKVDDAKHHGRRSAVRGLQAAAADLEGYLSGDYGEIPSANQIIVLAQSPEKYLREH